ncbi:MAG: hypothetical protein HQL27_10055 [Candidatus Omnitrophica bacterium]|nr:hypothetical protein [Candidatus Omnitrophota bacterium]
MDKRILKIAFIVFLLSGCNYLREFPLYSEVYVEHPPKIQLFTQGLINSFTAYSDTENAKEYFRIKKRISDYLDKNKNLSGDITVALENSEVILGMDKEQVALVLGLPTRKVLHDKTIELWIYEGDRSDIGERVWYYKWGKLKFENGTLKDIEVQHINIAK